MKIRMLAGVACAALMGLAVPANAATGPELPGGATHNLAADQAVDAFYAARGGRPLWAANGAATGELLNALQRAPLDGLASGPELAAQAQALMARAQAGDAAARPRRMPPRARGTVRSAIRWTYPGSRGRRRSAAAAALPATRAAARRFASAC